MIMNANELANELHLISSQKKDLLDKSVAMLRQQQSEIEALKKEAALQRLSDFTQEADNEPVAWMVKAPDGEYLVFENTEHPVMADCQYIPLYTHPAKTLTDEEILDFINAFCTDMGDYWDLNETNAIPMIRAILRKAQDK